MLEKKAYEKAVPLLQQLSDQGCARSQFNLANLYGQGLGVEKSLERMRELWTKAAEAGHPRACLNAAKAFERGEGGARDLARALRLYECAAELALGEAAEKLGNVYMSGGKIGKDGVIRRDPVAAVRWLTLAAEDGQQDAAVWLADLEHTVSPPSKLAGWRAQAVKGLISYDAGGPGPEALALPGRSTRLLYIAHTAVSRSLAKQGFVTNPGGATFAARDSPAAVLGKCRENLQQRGLEGDAMCVFVQRKGRYQKATRDARLSSQEQLFDTILSGDTLILADGLTTHYTLVFRAERTSDRILLADPWPAKFFLRKGLNAIGAHATLVDYKYGRKLIALSRMDFNKAVLGAILIRDKAG